MKQAIVLVNVGFGEYNRTDLPYGCPSDKTRPPTTKHLYAVECYEPMAPLRA